jgi:glycosyltransferase involved in cell wall biosynthesis
MVHIAVLMMVKNEKKRLQVSLDSIKGLADSLVIYDTGSEDNTIEIARTFCETNNIPFRLKEGTFVNFSVSRNESLDFAYTFDDIDYLLLMDVNDEIRGKEFLRKYAEEYIDNPSSGFLLCQEWYSGVIDKYFNVRFIKSRKEWYYLGVVHEYIKTRNEEYEKHPIVKLPDNTVLYQDRTQDDDKSGKRFARDKELLLTEFTKDPTESRTVFYLAQTCSCLSHNEDAFYYYKIRTTLEGFQEEKFHAFLRCGELSQKLGHSWYDSYIWYLKAFEHSPRAEPLLFLAIYYINIKNWLLAFTYVKLACSIPYPKDAILFVNRNDYDYKRWHLLGIVAYYVGQFADGKIGCLAAIQYCKSNPDSKINYEIDEMNLKFYEDKENENRNSNLINPKLQNEKNFLRSIESESNSLSSSMSSPAVVGEIKTKKVFIETMMETLKKEHPNLNSKQLNTRANMLWKNRQKLK